MGESINDENRDLRRRYQRIAPLYDLLDMPFEYWRYRPIRPLLFEGLSGVILDAGVGTGRNLPFYPTGAAVTGIDLSPAMLKQATRRLTSSRAIVELKVMDVTRLAFPNAYFDAAVASFLFCTLPDALQVAALCQIRRVVKPGGSIRLLEYSRPTGAFRRAVAQLWAPWAHWAYGASFDRRMEQYLPEAGLHLARVRNVAGDLVRLIEITTPG